MNGTTPNKRDYEDVRRKLLKLKSTIKSVEPLLKKIIELNETFKGLSELPQKIRVINYRVAQRLTAFVRKSLGSNYNLGRRSGKLFAAAIAGAIMGADAKGITIKFAGGQSPKLYKYGAAQNFGYVVGGKGLGAKAKRTIKKAAFSKKAVSARVAAGHASRGVDIGSLKVMAAHKFFELKDGQLAVFAEKYSEIWQEEVNRVLRRAKATSRR